MNAQVHYKQQSIETASPAMLVSMLYHAAVAAVSRAEQAMVDGRIESANRDLIRAEDIITELRMTLDFERGGEISRNLETLYEFCYDRLLTANLQKDPALLPAVRQTIAGLAESWDQMMTQQAMNPATAATG